MRLPVLRLLASALALGACSGGGDGVTDPGPLTHLVFQFCPGAVPIWGAYRNEGGAWTRFEGLASGQVEFDASERFAFAFVRQNGTNISTDVVYTAAAEIPAPATPTCVSTTTRSVSGNVAGIGSEQTGSVTMGTRGLTTTGAFTLTGVRDGALDVIASRRNATSLTAITADRIVIRRALNPASGEVLPTIDFGSAEAHDVATTTLTVAGLQSGETGSISFSLLSANQTFHSMGTRFTLLASQPMQSAPASLLVAGDYHIADVQAWDASGDRGRGVLRYYHAPANQSVSLGAALAAPAVTSVGSASNPRLRLTLASQTDYASQVQLLALQTSRTVTVTAVASHFGGTPATWSVEMPDLSGVDGWQATWGLEPGAMDVLVSAFGPTPARVGGIPVDGSTLRTAWQYGSM
jgi:hypothetical protein